MKLAVKNFGMGNKRLNITQHKERKLSLLLENGGEEKQICLHY